MFYIARCPICEYSELEKLEFEKDNEISFKCCDCGYEFQSSKANFDVIDDYEIRG